MDNIQSLQQAICQNKCGCNTKRQIKGRFLGLGNFNAKIMFICERPGWHTTGSSYNSKPLAHGITLLGNRSGDFFFECLADIGLSINDVYITNLVKCQAENNRISNDEEIFSCSQHLLKEIEIIRPHFIIIMGRVVMKYFFPEEGSVLAISGTAFKKHSREVPMNIGDEITYYILPHPAWALRSKEEVKYKEMFRKILKLENKTITLQRYCE